MNKKTLKEQLDLIGLSDAFDKWNADWEESQEKMPCSLSFLSPDYINDICKTLDIGEEVKTVLHDSLAMFNEKPFLRELIWHLHYKAFITEQVNARDEEDRNSMMFWDDIPCDIATYSGMFYALFALSGYQWVREKHGAKGIGETITNKIFGEVERWTLNRKKSLGIWSCNKIGWLSHIFSLDTFQIGRFIYHMNSYLDPFLFLRNKKTRAVMAFAHDGLMFRADGQFNGCNGINDPDAWRACFEESETQFIGNPVNPKGFIENRVVCLGKDEWEVILKYGDNVLHLHIPECGPMTPDICGESFREADEFFSTYFPEFGYKAMFLTSWIIDPQFEELLRPTSNLVLFLKELYLFPYEHASDVQMLDKLFNTKRNENGTLDFDALPQSTSLFKALTEAMKSGRRFRNQSSVFFMEDFDWGSNVYRKMYEQK